MSQANLVNSNLIGFAQADSFFKDALKLYKEKQYEEAALHFVEASKHGGLGGGEAEYYAGHIYYDKLDNIAEAEKYLRMAFEKKHILPTRYLDLVTNPTPSNRQGGGTKSVVELQTEIRTTQAALAKVKQQISDLEASHAYSIKNAGSFSNESLNSQVFGGALTDAKAQISQFWGNFLTPVKDNAFRYDLLAQDYGVTFPETFDAKSRARFEKQICQLISINEALDFMSKVTAQEYPLLSYIENLVALNVPRKQLYHVALKMHPLALTEKLAAHLSTYMCKFLNEEGISGDEIRSAMPALLAKDFCKTINILFWISKLMSFQHFKTQPGKPLSQYRHQSKDNMSAIDDENDNDDDEGGGPAVFCSLVAGFEDSRGNIISKEMVLSFDPSKH